MTAAQLAALAIFSAGLCLSPGPNAVMLLAVSANSGLRAAVPQLLGVLLGFTTVLFAAALAYSYVVAWLPTVQIYLKIAGGAMLLWLAWRIATATVGEQGGSSNRPIPFTAALLFQPVNPKVWTMAISTLALFVQPEAPLASAVTVAAVMSIVHVPCILCWGLGGNALRSFLSQPHRLRRFNAATGSCLAVIVVPLMVL